jgi:hypothetical protein
MVAESAGTQMVRARTGELAKVRTETIAATRKRPAVITPDPLRVLFNGLPLFLLLVSSSLFMIHLLGEEKDISLPFHLYSIIKERLCQRKNRLQTEQSRLPEEPGKTLLPLLPLLM